MTMAENPAGTGSSRQVWEEHYAARQQMWSGRVNAQLEQVARDLPAGRALDLGCGEGADAIWLAEHGWTVVGVDVSDTALHRARTESRARGVADRIAFECHDLAETLPAGRFDLVSAQFLHSTVVLDRPAILRRAATAVAPGGSLLIVDHAAAPPWASAMHHHDFPEADVVVAGLRLDPAGWHTVRVGTVDRTVAGRGEGWEGRAVTLQDNVIWVRRVA
jgi:SAM-dependent methyltransferase